jgi:hypothetical protein
MTISIISSIYPAYGATVFYANGAFTQNGIEWCEENKAIYDILGDKFFEHHKHSIESRVCANLFEDELWSYSGPDRVEKLIERSLYFSELEIAESQVEAGIGVVDPTPGEVRDNKIVNTQVGAMFITGFNQFYYSFSPAIADMERQSPLFKEFIKITITPLLVSLSLLNNVDINSEVEMLGVGIGIISLNAGLYFAFPIVVSMKLKRKLRT